MAGRSARFVAMSPWPDFGRFTTGGPAGLPAENAFPDEGATRPRQRSPPGGGPVQREAGVGRIARIFRSSRRSRSILGDPVEQVRLPWRAGIPVTALRFELRGGVRGVCQACAAVRFNDVTREP